MRNGKGTSQQYLAFVAKHVHRDRVKRRRAIRHRNRTRYFLPAWREGQWRPGRDAAASEISSGAKRAAGCECRPRAHKFLFGLLSASDQKELAIEWASCRCTQAQRNSQLPLGSHPFWTRAEPFELDQSGRVGQRFRTLASRGLDDLEGEVSKRRDKGHQTGVTQRAEKPLAFAEN